MSNFPRTPQWAFMIDLFYMSRNLEVSVLDDLFSTMELNDLKVLFYNGKRRNP